MILKRSEISIVAKNKNCIILKYFGAERLQ